MAYTTEGLIRSQAERAFRLRREASGGTVEAADVEVLSRWVATLVGRARDEGFLLTDRQYSDFRVGRHLAEGDRAKYVGPTRLEPTATGRNVLRPHGQRGRIIRVATRSYGGRILTFMPDVSVETQDLAAGADNVDVVQLVTAAWTDLERLG